MRLAPEAAVDSWWAGWDTARGSTCAVTWLA